MIVVTGASKGIGLYICKQFLTLDNQCKVLGVGRSDRSDVDIDQRSDKRFTYVKGDITHPNTIQNIVEIIGAEKVEILVNNAGILEPIERIISMDLDAFKRCFDVNLFAAVALTKALLPNLQKNGGKILNISSGAAINAYEAWSAYCATKAALNMFTQCLAKEVPEVYTAAIRPGVVATNMQKTIRDKGQGKMGDSYSKFVQFYDENQLADPSVPASAIAKFALYGPFNDRQLQSGQFFSLKELDME